MPNNASSFINLYQQINQFQVLSCQSVWSTLRVGLIGIVGCLLTQPLTSFAQDLNEIHDFNLPSVHWKISMSTSRQSQRGWKYVRHDGEGSIRNQPSRAKRAVQWNLSRNFNLTSSTQVDIKSYFKNFGGL